MKYTKFYLNGNMIEQKISGVTVEEFLSYAKNAFAELNNATYETDDEMGEVYFTSTSKKDGVR